jgi:hypothetical protein
VAPGCYEFTIYDEYGDGICCFWGEGSYEVINPNGVVVASGAEFDDLETTTICTNTIDVNEFLENNLIVYPNPAGDVFSIQAAHAIKEIRLFDAIGHLVLQQSNATSQIQVNTSQLPEGVYTITVVSEQGNYNRQVVVQH